jgi:hypothetical protein
MTTLAATAATDRATFLRRALLVDAATCVGTGALLALGSAPLAGLLGLPAPLLFWAGLSLFPCAAVMAWVALRTPLPRPGAWLVILGNAAWVAGSLAVLALFSPTALGWAFVIAQAVVVAALAELEYVGLRRTG